MEQDLESLLRAWKSFFIIIGPLAAVLITLQFVVIVLSADRNERGGSGTIRAFGTLTTIHCYVVFLVSACLSAPWPALSGLRIALGVCAAIGLLYTATIVRDARRQTSYMPVREDWLRHCVLPLLAYAALLAGAITLPGWAVPSLLMISASMLLLLLIGMNQARDALVHITVQQQAGQE